MRNTVIVVPCYNEALRLDVDAFTRFLTPRGELQLVFIDDGSTDATGALLAEMARCCPRQVKIRRLSQNSGKAEAVRQGMLLGLTLPDVAYIGYWDADLATPLSAIIEFQELLGETQALLVMGSRMRRLGSQVHRHALRHLFGRIWATATLSGKGQRCRAPDAGRRPRDEHCSLRYAFHVTLLRDVHSSRPRSPCRKRRMPALSRGRISVVMVSTLSRSSWL